MHWSWVRTPGDSFPFWECFWVGDDTGRFRGCLPGPARSGQRSRNVYGGKKILFIHGLILIRSKEYGDCFSSIVLETPPWFRVFGINFLGFQYILPPCDSLWPSQLLIGSAVLLFAIPSSLDKEGRGSLGRTVGWEHIPEAIRADLAVSGGSQTSPHVEIWGRFFKGADACSHPRTNESEF